MKGMGRNGEAGNGSRFGCNPDLGCSYEASARKGDRVDHGSKSPTE